MNKEECPVCKSNQYFTCDVSSISGTVRLTNCIIGQIELNVCTKCGCVFVGKGDLDSYNRTMNAYAKYFKR